jgi:hypothetical protein
MFKGLFLLAGLGIFAIPKLSHAVPFQLHAKTWTDVGRIMNSTDTLQNNFNGNWQQTMGMQFHGTTELTEQIQGGFGMGLTQVYYSLGNSDQEKFTLSKFVNYVSEARLTYKPNDAFSIDVGEFSFNYAPQIKNLGLYLFRGPVYPGFLVSGFKEFHTDTTRAGFLGLHFHNILGNFQHDLIFSSERDLPPSFDWSLGYVARYKVLNGLEIGSGVNFYHLLAENSNITTPNKNSVVGLFNKDSTLIANATTSGTPVDPYQLQYMEVVSPGDTVIYTHRGTKVMGMFNLDIKQLFGLDAPFGEKDLRFYGEAAIIGVKDYGTIYAKMQERIPFMIGFNFPTFGYLDFISLEVEKYPAKYKADYSKLGYDRSLYFKNFSAPLLLAQKTPSAIPISLKDLAGEKYTITPEGNFVDNQSGDTVLVKGTELDPENLSADDWKWAVNIEKTLFHHVQFSGQIANDHFVPRPIRGGLISETGGLSQILSTTKDWYFMFRVGYFF